MRFSKKLMASVLAGVVMLAGSVISLDSVQAADQDANARPAVERQMPPPPPRFNLNDEAKRLAECCNVNASQIVSYCNNGGDFRDACFAAQLAKLSGKSFNTVVQAKTDSNDWRQVAEGLGVTRDMLDADRRAMTAKRMAFNGNISEGDALKLMNEGYRSYDIEIAGAMAKASSKDVRTVLAMKKTNNNWQDVAKELNIDMSTLQNCPWGPQPLHGGHHRGYRDDYPDRGYDGDRGPGYGHGYDNCPAPDCPAEGCPCPRR